MSHVSDFTMSDGEILTTLILYANPNVKITAVTTDYLNPATNVGELNTTVTVAPKPLTGYTDVVDVFYDRLNIQAFVDIAEPTGLTIHRPDAKLLSDIIPDINIALGVNLSSRDYADQVLPTFEGGLNETKTVTVPMLSDSIIYVGTLSFSLAGAAIDLSSIILKTTLSGLNYPVV